MSTGYILKVQYVVSLGLHILHNTLVIICTTLWVNTGSTWTENERIKVEACEMVIEKVKERGRETVCLRVKRKTGWWSVVQQMQIESKVGRDKLYLQLQSTCMAE